MSVILKSIDEIDIQPAKIAAILTDTSDMNCVIQPLLVTNV